MTDNLKESLILEIQKQYPKLKLIGDFEFNECKFQEGKKLFLKTQFNFPHADFYELNVFTPIRISKFAQLIEKYNITTFYVIQKEFMCYVTFFNDFISVNF